MALVYKVFLPTCDPDAVSRVLKVEVDGNSSLVTIPPTLSSYELYPVKEGSSVSLSIRDTDNVGNKSEWSDVLSFTAINTIIPSTPGKVSVKLTGKVADVVEPPPPAPEPEPVLEEPPIEETPEDPPVSE